MGELKLRADSEVKNRDVVLFSGGLDSLYTAMLLKEQGLNPLLLFIDIGAQDIHWSKYYARKVAKVINCEFKIDNSIINIGKKHCYGHNLYIPRRNLFFGLIGAMYGKRVYLAGIKGDVSPDKSPGIMRIMFNAINKTGHKKERLEFFDSILWDKDKVQIVKEIIEKGYPESLLKLSYSCYSGNEYHCGACISCFRKWAVFKINGVNINNYFAMNPLDTKSAEYYRKLILDNNYQENIPIQYMKRLLNIKE